MMKRMAVLLMILLLSLSAAQATTLPILTEYADGESVAGWVCVILRGAAGWIRKTPKDTVSSTWFRPEMLEEIAVAGIEYEGGDSYVYFNDEESLSVIRALLTNVNDLGGPMAGCPFGATLFLELADGREVQLQVATDSCCVYRVDGRDYQYARHLLTAEGSPDNNVLFSLFGLNAQGEWLAE